MMEFFLDPKIIEYACSCGNLSPLTKLFFCRHCLDVRCSFCCHHEVSCWFLFHIEILITRSHLRWTHFRVPTAWKTFHHLKLNCEKTNAIRVSTAHHVSILCQLVQLPFRYQWHQRLMILMPKQN